MMGRNRELLRMHRDGTLAGREVVVLGRRRVVAALYQSIPGGVILDREVEGFVSWNVDALILAPVTKAAVRQPAERKTR
jgi:hypothetical protein